MRTSQDVGFMLMEAVYLEERRKELNARFNSYKLYAGAPIVESVEEAFQVAELRTEKDEIQEDLDRLASELGVSFPTNVWVLTEVGERKAKVKLYHDTKGTCRLKVDL